jgi:hypothetical protein
VGLDSFALNQVLRNVRAVCNTLLMQLLTAKQKAAELGISRATLSRRVQEGEVVPAFKDDSNPHNGVQLFEPEPVPA